MMKTYGGIRIPLMIILGLILVGGFSYLGYLNGNEALTTQTYLVVGGVCTLLTLGVTYWATEVQNKNIEKHSSTDDLTGLLNRRVFKDIIQRELNKARRYDRPISLMMIDVDHFKKINENYGYNIGDNLLKRLSKTFVDNFRSVDIISRWGGEEFLVLLPETDGQTAFNVAERIRTIIAAAEMDSVSGTINCSVSIGIVSEAGGKMDKEDLVIKADQAMLKAKEAGRNSTYLEK